MLGSMIGLQLLAGLLLAPHVLADLVLDADNDPSSLAYSDAWGTQSACNGCSYVKGRVIERTQEEVKNLKHNRQGCRRTFRYQGVAKSGGTNSQQRKVCSLLAKA